MPDSKIRILIVSRTPWNEANSFGNTFTNLFSGIKNIEIANICCQGGTMNSRLIDEAFQLTDKAVAKSILGLSSGQLIKNGFENTSSSKLNAPRKTIFYVLREAIWALGRWRSTKLKSFILEFNPDIVYIPVYRSHYMCEVDKYVLGLSGVPYVVHISDDVYGFPPKISVLDKLLQSIIRNDIRQILKGASYGEVFSPLMAEEYEKEFKIPFFVIGKSVDKSRMPDIPLRKRESVIRFVYTGNYGGERGCQLVSLAKSIAASFPKGTALLDIYSATRADDNVVSQLAKIECVRLMGSVSPERVLKIQQQADYLIHAEGFTPEAIFESRLSFSTKIIDYLLAGRPIIAIGPVEVTSINVLKSHQMAYVATNFDEIKDIMSQIAEGQTDDDIKVRNGRKYLLNNRDEAKIKAEMYQRIVKLLK